MKKRFYLLALLAVVCQTAQAQIELVPLTENAVLQRASQDATQLPEKMRERLLTVEKNTCANLQQPGVNYVITGQTLTIPIKPDTALGEVISTCIACNAQPFGSARISGDTLFYTANNIGDFGEDQIQIEYCSKTNPTNCKTINYRFRVRRAGRTVFQQTPAALEAEERVDTLAFGSEFFKKISCPPVVLNCADKYPGAGQERVSVLTGTGSYQLVYRAGRYPGIDSVCVVLCDSFAVCDTFKFAFQIKDTMLDIPFMDDFSYFGPYPQVSHWLDRDAFVNNDMADTPPSWGVATFDGLNDSGTAYGGGYGDADKLTSNFINLQNILDSVYLSYWVQQRGFGDAPERQDSFVVEFKRRDGTWMVVDSLPGGQLNARDTAAFRFRFRSILVPNDLKYRGFQFRFRNKSDRTGLLDVWHLDYVRMDTKQPSPIFTDVAFTQMPESILKRYTNMPWKQFRGFEEAELKETITAHVWNHSVQKLGLDSSRVRLWEESSFPMINMFNVTLFNGEEGNFENGKPVTRTYSLKDSTKFINVWNTYLTNMKDQRLDNVFNQRKRLDLRLRYLLFAKEENDSLYDGSLMRNNMARRFTTFSNYYSHDDGTAEEGLIVQRGFEVAVKFTLNKPDTLRGIQFHFPRTTVDISSQRFTMKVWIGQLDNTPEYESPSQQAYYTDVFFDTLQGFTTYLIQNQEGKLALPAGDFYVGWEQDSPCDGTRCVAVGYDRNTPTGAQAIFERTSNRWTPLSATLARGALMIRPVVGNETPIATDTDDPLPSAQGFTLYPNPTRDLLNIVLQKGKYEDFQYLIFNTAGQRVGQGTLQAQLQVGDLPSGIYFLRIADRKSNQMWNEKFIIAQ